MATKYPNIYYEQLAQMVIKRPSLSMKRGEVCFYQGRGQAFQTETKTIEKKGKTKTSFFITPWFAGIRKRTTPGTVQKITETEYYQGMLYVTNMRMVFTCRKDSFDLLISQIKNIAPYKDGIKVTSGRKSYAVKTADVQDVLRVINLMNKAQTAK